ncbi:MAG: hypothetical protein ACXABD_02610 [Candidatus Thorarchaeota archaeon]|jgi:hypothetical protein
MTERDSIDVHKELLPYNDVLSLFEEIERKNIILEYCNGANAGGRLVFQFLNQEFVLQRLRPLLTGFSNIQRIVDRFWR